MASLSKRAWKALQKRLLDCFSTSNGVLACLIGLLVTVILGFYGGETLVRWSREQVEAQFSDFHDNIGGASYQHRLCSPLPIDVVYTWVNGSDPVLLADLAELKLQMELERNMTERAKRTKENLERLRREAEERNRTALASANASLSTLLHPTPSAVASIALSSSPLPSPTPRVPAPPPPVYHFKVGDDRTLAIGGVTGMTAGLGLRSALIQDALHEACGPVDSVMLDYYEIAGFVHFSDATPVHRCLALDTVRVEQANITFAPVSFIGNASFSGLGAAPAAFGLDRPRGVAGHDTVAPQPDDPVALGMGVHDTAMITNVPRDLSKDLLDQLLAPFGNVTRCERHPLDGIVLVTFALRWSLIDFLAAGRLAIHRGLDPASWRAQHLPVYPTEPPVASNATAGRNSTGGANATVLAANNTAPTVVLAPHPNATRNRDLPIVGVVRAGMIPALGEATVDKYRNGSIRWDDLGVRSHTKGHVDDEISTSRFQDNSELQYSLRAIAKNAPWVRNIYVVTNGQIPSWLDLDHPRLRVVTHEEIFTNKSNLPTFSSPSIETQLHNIPGLSEHFLYLNDDVMFGEPVWPDDFYTESRGQKVVLAWPVPNCAEGCPSNWIGDKYCDAACNSTECDWDGGDCLKKAAEAAAAAHDAVVNKHTPSSAIHSFCEDGCSDAWLGDKYCDAACNKEQCGFDAGDCGVADIQASLPRLDVTWDTEVVDQTLLRTPSGQLPQAVYVNLTRLFGNSTITAGSYESEDVVAGAVVSQPDKVLVIVLRKGLNATMATFSVSAEGGPNGTAWTKSFNVTLQTTELTTTTLAPATLNASQLAANATALNTSAILGPNVTNGSQAMRLVDASAINYWDVAGNNTASTATPAPPPTKRATSAIFPPPPKDLDRSTLPAEIQDSWASLSLELSAGDITEKGYHKYLYMLLLPYANYTLDRGRSGTVGEGVARAENVSIGSVAAEKAAGTAPEKGTNGTDPRRRRRLLSTGGGSVRAADLRARRTARKGSPRPPLPLRIGSLPGQGLQHPGDGWEIRGGHVVDAREGYLADWIADSKRKQLSLPGDLRRAVARWEDRTGQRWTGQEPAVSRGVFPWEKQGVLRHLDEVPAADTDLEEYPFRPPRAQRRQLQDTFGDSLKHVNRMYNKRFGYTARKVIAHMPHFLRKSVLQRLAAEFPEEWETTASHKLRSGTDMQYAFAYMWYLISLKREFNATDQFVSLDTDRDGLLGVQELRTLITRLYDLPTSMEHWVEFEAMLLNCSAGQPPQHAPGVGIGPDATEVWVDVAMFSNCTVLLDKIKAIVKDEMEFKHETEEDEKNVAFKMLNANVTMTIEQLDNIRKHPKKFVCLNDNIDHRKPQSREAVEAIQGFYQALFPIPSEFELPPGFRNRFLHINELREWHDWQLLLLWWSRLVLLVAIVLFSATLFSARLRRVLRLS